MMNIVYKRVDEIIPYEKNPRINDAAVDCRTFDLPASHDHHFLIEV